MLPALLLAAAPFLLIAPASAGPRILARQDLEPTCVEITETITFTTVISWLEETTSLPATSSADPPTILTEHYSPIGTSSRTVPTDTIHSHSHTIPSEISSSEPTRTSQSLLPSPSGSGTANQGGSGRYTNALYFTNWGIYGADFQPQQLPASEITHVLFSFADIAADGEVKSSDEYADLQKHYPTDSWNDQGNNAYGCVKQLYLLKKKNRGMKVLLSIGGWTYSSKFAPIAATEAGRQKFASSAVALVKDWGFDGLDIDWEYPASAEEGRNFVLLLQACRQALDNYAQQHAPGYHFLITIATSAGPTHYRNMDFAGMEPLVDNWNLMAYDYAGSWDTTSGHQANLYVNTGDPASTKFSTEQAVEDYLAAGIPSHKISMGLPLYGRSFEDTTGLGQPYSGIGSGSVEAGVWLYKDLPRPGAREAYDDVAKASYSYDTSTKELITYDTVFSATAKAQYLVSKGLGGAVFWEASGDRTGSESLVGTVAKRMGDLDMTPNLLSYPVSKYDNIRAGMPDS
ncbi:glycoside hydrolase family 18 protein [Phialemonium atrogriseum]|uniref:chitinase n=1 Tax=Phialemonium atrogriseum TaxID=1093897 RepID=A0AAJ0C469_9PEZI|nr:glycoside hydrolase family 18 protein [Phialemonium atrogriseum]KAK1768367.1 glycoside hydrolase family 18 protein [Phialemonium atrogriseum]